MFITSNGEKLTIPNEVRPPVSPSPVAEAIDLQLSRAAGGASSRTLSIVLSDIAVYDPGDGVTPLDKSPHDFGAVSSSRPGGYGCFFKTMLLDTSRRDVDDVENGEIADGAGISNTSYPEGTLWPNVDVVGESKKSAYAGGGEILVPVT